MRGVILAGGLGSRLYPITEVTNKHLLPVYDRPMIFHPLDTLLRAGIKDILIVSSPEHAGAFLRLLKNGQQFDANFTFRVQNGNGGIAEALGLAEDFAHGDDITVILGDNIFEDDFSEAVKTFKSGATLFLKDTDEARRFGVAEIVDGKLVGIEEKPKEPKSTYAITGIYIFDSQVFNFIKRLEPSWRNELEITDVNNFYIEKNEAQAIFVEGRWTDAGTFESLYMAGIIARDRVLGQMETHIKERVIKGIKVTDEEHNRYPRFVPVKH
ncbi:spore coat protein [Candidatus Peregrinibacteria bacterium CG11_big_fil_rev_8_21_14_0_20_41_10]|nr:MAG: spore coat protein [Candidatus Peregrinibacteria bacterium CG11_big_fil_rev_8_21_14_0_20_41_10]PIZ75803.1 MAG: spore coat protein [Candidatus Peregrinibacteria bacterium CG_4_10_14_0_2_um_filter_41_8]PJC38260.1 MAG: spore coat protein [Candidatus Peregrinibacteria bacterium CG_4_9_14_0_2_um_filter_41_14]